MTNTAGVAESAALAEFLESPAHGIRLAAEGATGSRVFDVRHPTGRYALRRLRPDMAFDRAEAVAAVHATAYAAGLPVPQPIPSRQGAATVATDEGVYSLSEFIDGRTCRYRDAPELCAAGALLAAWHCALDNVRPLPVPGPTGSLRESGRLADRFERAVAIAPGTPRGEAVLHWARRWLSDADVAGFLGGDNVLAHGDFHAGNLLYRPNGRTYVVDFDNADRLPSEFDLGYAVLMMCRRRRGDFELRYDEIALFVGSYLGQGTARALLDPHRVLIGMVLSQVPEPDLILRLPPGDPRRVSVLASQVRALSRIREMEADIAAWLSRAVRQASVAGVLS